VRAHMYSGRRRGIRRGRVEADRWQQHTQECRDHDEKSERPVRGGRN
jgi:hypothetical protein